MRKFTIMLLLLCCCCCCFAQLAPDCFEDPDFELVLATSNAGAGDWLTLQGENGLFTQWIVQPHAEGTFPSSEGITGTHAVYMDKENVDPGLTAVDYLITPEFNLPPGAQLKFLSRLTTPGDNGTLYKIMILPEEGDPADPNAYEDIPDADWTEFEINPNQLIYNEITVTIPAEYENTAIRVAFVMEGDNGDRWLIDCVSVTELCLPPVNLAVEGVGLDQAILTWDNSGGATLWEVEIVPEDNVPTGHGIVYSGALPYVAQNTATGNPLVMTPFVPGTGYKYYVKAICDDGGYSEWVGAYYFSTVNLGETCEASIEVVALPYSDTGNTAIFANNYAGTSANGCGNQDFEGNITGNDVMYSYTAGFTGTLSIDLSNIIPYAAVFIYNECEDFDSGCISGGVSGDLALPIELEIEVTSGEDYYIVVTSYFFETTNYTLTIQQASCNEPEGLPTTNLGFTTANLSWTNPGGAAAWQVEIQPVGNGIPSGPGEYTVNTNAEWPVPSADLASSTAYEYYVRADCGDGTFSAWGGPYYFNTAICEPEDKCTYLFAMWNDYGGGWNGYTMDVVQNGVIVATLAGPQAGEPEIQEVALCEGYPFLLIWNTDGYAADGIRVSIENNFEQSIYTKYLGVGSPGETLYTHDVLDCDLPLCLPPTGLTASNPTLNTIDLAWDGPTTGEWEYIFVEPGDDAPEATDSGTITTTNPAVATGPLEAATEYEYYLRILCDGTSTPASAWSGPFPFSTSVCAEADKCEYTFVMKSEWGAGWYGGYMTISQGGVTVDEIGAEFTTGTEMEVTVMLCHDEPIEIFWNSGGGYDFQMGLDVRNQFEQIFFSMPFNSGGLNTNIYEGTADCVVPLCLPPSGLTASNPTLTTIDLAWDGPATGQWEYFITEAGQPGPDDSSTGTLTSSNPAIGAGQLEPATLYDYYVRMVCEDDPAGPSEWGGPFEFNTTLCGDEDKCDYTFKMKAGWSNGWLGGSMTITQNGIVVDVIGPEFSSGVEYDLIVPICDDLPIEVNWTAGGAWAGQMGLEILNNFGQTVYSLPVNNGGLQLGQTIFEWEHDCDTPACIMPTGLYSGNQTPTTIDLGWGGPAIGAWEYYIVEAGEPAPDGTTTGILTNTNPALAVPLPTPATNYEYYVRMVCEDEDEYSPWSLPHAIHSAVCEPEDRCTYTFEMISNQYPGYTGNIMIITQSGTPVATIGSQFTTGLSMTVDVLLCPNAPYEVIWVPSVNANIGLIIRNSYDEVEFTMQSTAVAGVIYTGIPTCESPTCPKPEDLSISNIADISIDLSWTETGTATQWEVFLTEQGATAPVAESIGVIADTNPFTLTEGIEPGVNYDVYLRSHCVDNEVSLWTGPLAFQSSQCPLENQCSYTFIQSTSMLAEYGFNGWIGDVMYIIQGGVIVATLEGPMVEDNNDDVITTITLCNGEPFTINWDNPGGTLQNQYVGIQVTNNFTEEVVFNMPPVEVQTVPLGDIFTAVTECTDCEPIGAGEANDVFACSQGEVTTIDLTEAAVGIIEDPELYEFIYYSTEEAATTGGDDNISPDYAAVAGATDLWVRIQRQGETCFTVKGFTVTIHETPEAVEMDDLTACDSYTLPSLPAGNNYFTISNGGGEMLAEGDMIDSTQTIYIFAESGTTPNCIDESSFVVTITVTPEITTPGNQSVCSSYILPELVVGNYYTGAGGTGIMLEPGDVVSTTQEMYVYAGTSECFDEAAFTVTIFETPDAVEMEDITECDSYTLPALPSDNEYFTASNGGGEMLAEGDVIDSTQTIYIFAESGTTPNCIDESSFVVTIVPSPEFSLGESYMACEASAVLVEVVAGNFDTNDALYEWKINENVVNVAQSSINATEFGNYQVTVTVDGCSTTHSVEVIENNIEIAAVIDDFCDEDIYTVQVIDVNGSFDPGMVVYSWTGPGGFTADTQVITPTLTGIYDVIVKTAEGCNAKASFEVIRSTCFIQQGISPNGDGKNDFLDLRKLEVTYLIMFNRYGQEVYSRANYTNQWRGQMNNGDDLPTGTYFYMIQKANGEHITGWVYLNRED